MKTLYKILAVVVLLFASQVGIAQKKGKIVNKALAQKELDYYKIVDVPIPKDIVLEVGGLALTDDGKLGVSTRRGEVWVLDNPNAKKPTYKLFAKGMHEILGLAYKDNGFYATQRSELTRLEDEDKNGVADYYKTVFSWPLSGNYHEYSYGPKFDNNGDMILTLNATYMGDALSMAKWRGWLIRITPEGKMTPLAAGLRSPAGFDVNANGDIFYTENQGEWVGSGRMTHIEKGDFAGGNPMSLQWTGDKLSPLSMKPEDLNPDEGVTLYEYAKIKKEVKAPAIWFPHTIQGISTSDILYDTTNGKFGPFAGQMFVGDQGHSKVVRVFMEKVNGVYQGASFLFKENFSSGVLRMIWGDDSNMFVGMTSRGWSSTGRKSYGLQRLVWTGKTPFEIKKMKALNDGFELEFTKPINKKMAQDLSNYKMSTFTYGYHKEYGSPIVDAQKSMIHKAVISADGLKVKLTIHGMRLGYIHQIEIPKLTSASGELLLHNTGYYTLNEVPGGELKSPQMQMSKTSKKTIKQPKRVNTMPSSWGERGADEKVVIGTIPGLKYDTEEITINRNSNIELTLNNNDDMIHNVVITKPGKETPLKIGELALSLGLEGSDLNYVPFDDRILFHTGTVPPESNETIYFKSPSEPGEYWIVCTFPGHSFSMRAKLIVK
ncbi:plastocyanin/azurin family copper-binding protein [Polaribacter sp. Z014]|uniref:plastocyanin/azurin family copper-binding protein n=1 Tax=Polaribacter sp. Z014 TaxID=2927126 RepID=UPI002021723A|nr:plastocyanin/azurin family copper-binding protein [Polaribacter sp. Z014]MCL7763965.1 plastocyanin/azurin family copper-binding protein [Polaribacter sp. Z014]